MAADSGDYVEGSPMDRNFYLACILAAFVVLSRRGVSWGEVIRANRPLMLFYAYLALSMLWSDYPFVTVKRVFKDFGNVVMVLVMMTEANPGQAIRAVFLRCGYVLIPLSVVFIKYYPELGRAYSRGGGSMATGVTMQKNALGQIVTLVGLIVAWEILEKRKTGKSLLRHPPIAIGLVSLMGLWLIQSSQSKTSLVCLFLCLLFLFKPSFTIGTRGRAILILALFTPLVLLSLQKFGSFIQPFVEMLGRDLTFTGRTDIWHAVLAQPINPFIGSGYLAFWDGAGGDAVFEAVELRGAHNGFLEVYLDGGLIGLTLLYVTLFKRGYALTAPSIDRWKVLRFAFVIGTIFYNLTEGFFGRLSLVWFATILVLVESPFAQFATQEEPALEEELVSA